jgi:rhodanese-related sulfurtransferase
MRKILFILSVAFLLMVAGCGTNYSDGGVFGNSKQIVNEVKADVNEISYDDFKELLESGELRILIDVREVGEFDEGYINQPDDEDEYPYPETFTVNIPRGLLEFKVTSQDYWDDDLWVEMPAKDEMIVVYCKSGGRGVLAAYTMQQMGFTNVYNLKGGYRKWLDPTLPDEEEDTGSSGG